MRQSVLVAVVTGILVHLSLVVGQNENKPAPAKPSLDRAEVLKWVGKLGSPEFRVREEAEEKLASFGVEVIPFLEEALSKEADPTVQRHLRQLLARFNAAPTLTPTRLRLQLKGATLQETIRELSQATGYRIELPAMPDTAEGRVVYNWDWQNVTFWEALDDLCKKAGVSYVEGWYSANGKTIRLEPGESHPSYTSLSGPFRVTVVGFHYNRSLSFMTGPTRWNNGGTIQRNESLNVSLRVTIEPRYAFTGVRDVHVEEAIDDTGVSRQMPRPDNGNRFVSYYYGGGRMYQQQVSAQLLPGNLGGKLKIFRGQIDATVVAAERPIITFDDAASAKGKRVEKNGTTVQVEEVRDDGQSVQVRLRVSRVGEPNRRDPNWVHSVPQRIKLFDAKGSELNSGGAMSWTTNADSAEGTLTFYRDDGNAAPKIGIGRILGGKPKSEQLKLVYYEWDIVPTQIPFSFRDVPLP
jgi:hypothetical protein